MPGTSRDTHIQKTINSLAHVDGNGLVPVPVEQLDPAKAIRVLQIQIFELSDAVADLSKTVQELQGRSR